MRLALAYSRPPWRDGTFFSDGTGWLEDLTMEDAGMDAATIRQQLREAISQARSAAESEMTQLRALLDELDRMEAALTDETTTA